MTTQGKGKMKIVDTSGQHVATLDWDGSLWAGRGEWSWFKDDMTRDKVETAIRVGHVNLGRLRVSDMYENGAMVDVWKGFSGMFGGLCLALPSYGMDVDRQAVEWPGGGNTDYKELYLP